MLDDALDILSWIADLMIDLSMSNRSRFAKIDRIVHDWSSQIGLELSAEYKGEKVYSWTKVDDRGNRFHMYLETRKRGRSKVRVTNNRSGLRRKTWSKKCRTSKLTQTLFEGRDVIDQWISKSKR